MQAFGIMPAPVTSSERGVTMPGFDGSGPGGRAPMTGGGRGYCAIPIGSREKEMDILKTEALALRVRLREIEARIGKVTGRPGASHRGGEE